MRSVFLAMVGLFGAACGGVEATDGSADPLSLTYLVQGQPDLAIEATRECAGAELEVLVWNHGPVGAANVVVDLMYGPSDLEFSANQIATATTLPWIRPGSPVSVTLRMRNLPQFRVRVDPANRIAESNEGNNVYHRDCSAPDDTADNSLSTAETAALGTAGG